MGHSDDDSRSGTVHDGVMRFLIAYLLVTSTLLCLLIGLMVAQAAGGLLARGWAELRSRWSTQPAQPHELWNGSSTT
jgi:hypothetical protein